MWNHTENMIRAINRFLTRPTWFVTSELRQDVSQLLAEFQSVREALKKADNKRVHALERAVERLEREKADIECSIDRDKDEKQILTREIARLHKVLNHIHDVSVTPVADETMKKIEPPAPRPANHFIGGCTASGGLDPDSFGSMRSRASGCG